jgi:hypothetical protein
MDGKIILFEVGSFSMCAPIPTFLRVLEALWRLQFLELLAAALCSVVSKSNILLLKTLFIS